MKTTLNNTQTELMNEVIAFGKGRGFDFKNMTKETLNDLMKLWLEVGRDFNIRSMELPTHQVKTLLKF